MLCTTIFLKGSGSQPVGHALHSPRRARVGYRMGEGKKIWGKKKKIILKISPMSKCKWLDYYNTQTNLMTFTGVIGDFCGVWRLVSTYHSAVLGVPPPSKSTQRWSVSQSLAQQSNLQSEQRGDTHHSSSRWQMNRGCAWPPPFRRTERGVNVPYITN